MAAEAEASRGGARRDRNGREAADTRGCSSGGARNGFRSDAAALPAGGCIVKAPVASGAPWRETQFWITSDLDELFRHVESQGARVLQRPGDRPWGTPRLHARRSRWQRRVGDPANQIGCEIDGGRRSPQTEGRLVRAAPRGSWLATSRLMATNVPVECENTGFPPPALALDWMARAPTAECASPCRRCEAPLLCAAGNGIPLCLSIRPRRANRTPGAILDLRNHGQLQWHRTCPDRCPPALPP